jgi:cytochrome c oxidase subunit 2
MQQAGRSRIERPTLIALALIVILGVVTVVGALTVFQLPEAITEQARRTERLYLATLVISFIVFFGVTAGIIYACFRFRRRDPMEIPNQIHGSSVLEFTWTAIPVLILVGLFIPSLLLVLDLKTPPARAEADVVIEVIGHQWWWEFNYVNDGVRVQPTPPNYDQLDPPRMVVPVDAHVLLIIRSTDVVHSFSSPNLLYKIQAIPGNTNQMHFRAEKTGEFHGACYQFCGLRHADMRFTLDVRSASDYQAWLRERRAASLSEERPNEGQVAGLVEGGQ